MELSFNELKKRDVINVPDGRCLGRIVDLKLNFPNGVLSGIVVPGRKTRRIFAFFDRSEIYIDRSRIIKIGGDVILVDISTCNLPPRCPPHKPDKNCSPPHGNNHKPRAEEKDDEFNFNIFPENNGRIDMGDY